MKKLFKYSWKILFIKSMKVGALVNSRGITKNS